MPATEHQPGAPDEGIEDVQWLDDVRSGVPPRARRLSLRTLLYGAGLLALIAVVVAVVLPLMRPIPPYQVVPGFDRPPSVLHSAEVIDNWGFVGGMRWLDFSATDPTQPLVLRDLTTREELWRSTELVSPDAAAIRISQTPSADRLAVVSLADGTSIFAIAELSSGRRVGELTLPHETELLFSDEGRPLLVTADEQGSSVTLLGSLDADDVVWTYRFPSDSHYIGSFGEEDGYLVSTLDQGMGDARHILALSVDDGSPAPWLDDDSDWYVRLGDRYLVQRTSGLQEYALREADGDTVWETSGTARLFALDDRLYSLDKGDEVERLDPDTREPLWDRPTEVAPGSRLALFEGMTLAFATYPDLSIQVLDPETGRIRHQRRFGGTSREGAVIAGEGKLFVVDTDDERTRMVAVEPEQGDVLWERSYLRLGEIVQLDRGFLAYRPLEGGRVVLTILGEAD